MTEVFMNILCILTLAAIAIRQTYVRYKTSKELFESTALLAAISNVIEMDKESQNMLNYQIDRNKKVLGD